jgi:hypothetical protein
VTLALAAIAAGGLMLLDRLAGAAGPLVGGLPWPLSRFGQLGPFAPLAVALLVIGLGLVVTAFLGRARWLILVGLVLLPGVSWGVSRAGSRSRSAEASGPSTRSSSASTNCHPTATTTPPARSSWTSPTSTSSTPT